MSVSVLKPIPSFESCAAHFPYRRMARLKGLTSTLAKTAFCRGYDACFLITIGSDPAYQQPLSPVEMPPFAPQTSSALRITDPLVLYRSLLATKRIDPDPAQHRLAIRLQSLYSSLKDYSPLAQYSHRLEAISRASKEVPSVHGETQVAVPGQYGDPFQLHTAFSTIPFETSINDFQMP